jgi:hypothetical protein
MALTRVGFLLIVSGDTARAQPLFEQSLPLYRQVSEKLGVTMNVRVLAILGHLAAGRRDYADADRLQGQALLRELRDDDLSGYDRFENQMTARVDNVLGQVRLSQGDNDAAARTASSLSLTGPLTLGSDPARFQTEPPACYRAPWRLPGPDFHRQAATSLRTRRNTMALGHGVTSYPAGRTRNRR